MWISNVCVYVCLCVVISSSLFYEYMNIFNGHLSQGRFPDDKFLGKDFHSPFDQCYCQPCFLCILSPRKIRTTASVFDYGYFKTKFIFYPLRPKGYIRAVVVHNRVMFTEIIFIIIIEWQVIFVILFISLYFISNCS